jgi:hypothetical protein
LIERQYQSPQLESHSELENRFCITGISKLCVRPDGQPQTDTGG